MIWKGKGRRALSFLLALVLALSLLPASALAVDSSEVATASGQSYSSIEDAWNAVLDGGIIVLMQDCTISSRLILDSGKRITVNMNGHKIDRGRTSDTKNGEVICIEKNASLTLQGATTKSNISYTGWTAPTSTKEDPQRQNMSIATGGLITGGYSTNGAGGIHMKDGASLTLDNVAVAGNRAYQPVFSDGYGGGIMLAGKNAQLILKNGAEVSHNVGFYGGGVYINGTAADITMSGGSKIDNNYAEKDGGGIYSNDFNTSITMTGGSEINSNSAIDGGGLYFNYSYFSLKSTDASGSISKNTARVGDGGAICVASNRTNGNSGTIYGITCDSNRAAGDTSKGGAIYLHQESVVTSGCKLTNNSAVYGGGIYINNDLNTISSSTITNNTAETAGGGVYIDSMNDITLSGKVIVENNRRTGIEDGENAKDDLYPQSGVFTYTNILGTPSGKSRIGIRTEKAEATYVGSTKHYFLENAFFSDFDGWIIQFDEHNGALRQVKGETTPTAVETVNSPKRTNTNKYYNDEPLYKGYFSYPSIEESTEDLDAVFYYSDGYFLNADPKTYDAHLATMSMAMAMAGFYSNIGNSGKDNQNNDISDRTYTYKSQNIEKLLNDIGVTADKIYISNSNSVKPGTDTIGVAIGQKTIYHYSDNSDKYILVPIAIRGAGYESEWYSNTTLGTSGEHAGFASAADQVFQQVQNYIRDYGLTDAVSKGKVKFWIAGYSRAGATANLTAKRLIEAYCAGGSTSQNNQVYAYCFEAPKGGLNSAMTLKDKSAYFCIHNCINKVDVVPLVAPEEMGFIRYGVDHYVPGTEAGEVNSDSTVWSYVRSKVPSDYTTWFDNSSYTVGDNNYNTKRADMIKQLAALDPDNIHFYDQFNMGTINYLGSATGAYDLIGITPGNITQEEFGQVLMRSLLSWGLQKGSDFRGGYTMSSPSFQQAMQTVTKLLFGKNAAQLEGMMNAASGTMDRLSTSQLMDVYKDMIGNWTTLSQSKRDDYLQMLWDVVIEGKTVDGEYVAKYLTPAEKAELRSAWNVLLDVLLRFAEVDYNTSSQNWNKSTTSDGEKTQTPILDGIRNTNGSGLSSETQAVLGTLAYNASALMQAHYPEINFAWLRSFDDFYTTNETKHVEITAAETPTVTSSILADGTTWTETTGGNYSGDQILKLTTGTDTPGAGIYYRVRSSIYPNDTHKNYSDWMPYNQPIHLTAKNSEKTYYSIQTTAVYCGNTAAVQEITYTIERLKTHSVKVNGSKLGDFEEGDWVTIDGTPTGKNVGKVFKEWGTHTPTDLVLNYPNATGSILINKIIANFTMPDQNVSIDAVYIDPISNPTLTVDKPVAGQDLPTTGKLSWTVNETAADGTTTQKTNTKEIPVYWLEQVDGKTQTASGKAKYGTGYSVAALVEQDVQNDLVFASNLTKSNAKVIYTGLTPESETQAYQADVNAEGALRIFGNQVTTAQAEVTSVPNYAVKILKNSVQDTKSLKELLPKNITVETNDGKKTLDLNYTEEVLNAALNAVKGNAGTTYDATATIDYNGTNLTASEAQKTTTVHITIYTNGTVAEPTANKVSGSYEGASLAVKLETGTNDATIKYKVGNGQETAYDSTTGVELNCGEGKTETYTITAWAEKSAMDKSPEVTFVYTLTNPLPTYTVTINGKDTGAAGTDGSHWTQKWTYTYTKGDKVTIAAPAEADERFEKWDTVPSGVSGRATDTALTVNGITGDIELTAVYNPVVKALNLTVDAPVIGAPLADKVKDAEATVTNPYPITDLFNKIEWSPNSSTADYNTVYTAKLTLRDDAGVKYFLKDDLKPRVNDGLSATVVKEDDGNYAVYVTFPATDKLGLVSVAQPDNGHATRANAAQNKWGLPNQTTLTLSDGSTTSANIAWDTVTGYNADMLEAQVLTATGRVEIPSDVQKGEVSDKVEVKVYVDAADQVAMPTASLSSGSYTGEQVLRLSCETEKAEIYYTLDGSDPNPDAAGTIQYTDGGIITLPNSTAVTELHVIAVRDGMRNSMMAMYRYDVTRQSSGGSGGSSKPVNPPEDQPSTGGSDYKNCSHGSTCPLTKFTDLNANAWYHDGVHYCLDSGLMAGYGNALFGPNDKLSRAQVVTVLWRMAKSPAPTAENSFTDVPADTWYTDAVRWAAENGVVGGYGDGRFGPNDPVTREQMAAMFYRFAKQQGRDVTQRADLGTYADAASVSDWAKEALQWACGAGLINGMDGSLVPQGTATRAQTAAVLQRLSALTQ